MSRNRKTDTRGYGDMMRRMMKAYGNRVAGDLGDLPGLVQLRTEFDEVIASAVTRLHDAGYSWTEIGEALGVSRQAARQRYEGPPPPVRRQSRGKPA